MSNSLEGINIVLCKGITDLVNLLSVSYETENTYTSGSLLEQEMLWEHRLIAGCFLSITNAVF